MISSNQRGNEMISERSTIPNPFNNDEINVDIEYEVSFYEGNSFDVEIKSLVTDEFVELIPYLSFKYLDDLKAPVMAQYKQNHQ